MLILLVDFQIFSFKYNAKAYLPEFFTYSEQVRELIQGFLECEVQKNSHNVLLRIKFPIHNSDFKTIRH